MTNFFKYISIIFSAILLISSSSIAATYSIVDHGNNIYAGFSHPANDLRYGDPVSGGLYTEDGTPIDHIGVSYDTYQVDLTMEDGGISVDIFTLFSGTASLVGLDNEIADFFFDFDLDGTYEYGVDLSYGGGGFFSAGVYSLTSWITSEDIFHDQILSSSDPNIPDTGAYYGGWMANGGNEIAVDFDLTSQSGGNTFVGAASGVSRTEDGGGSGIYQYSFTLEDTVLQAMGVDSGSFAFLFGTAECGNDVVMGTVPEPATIMLFGIGLLGLSAVGRKRS